MLKRHPIYYIRHADKYAKRFVLPLLPSHRPNFLIVGAQKAATTSLYSYLNQVPGLVGSSNKEVYYFDRQINHGKDLRWYHSYFKSLFSSDKLFFEATPNYLYYPWVAKNIYRYDPNMKMVVVLRDPGSRAFSAWNMYHDFFARKELFRLQIGLWPNEKNYIYEYLFRDRKIFPSFEECINLELKLIQDEPSIYEPSFLRRGLYSRQIEEYYRYFKCEQLFFIGYRDLIREPVKTVSRLCEWLTGNRQIDVEIVATRKNARKYVSSVDDDVKNMLDSFYCDEKHKVEALIGRNINW